MNPNDRYQKVHKRMIWRHLKIIAGCASLLLMFICVSCARPGGIGAQSFKLKTQEGQNIIVSYDGNISQDEAEKLKGEYFCEKSGYEFYYQDGHSDYALLIGKDVGAQKDGRLILFHYQGFANEKEWTVEKDMQMFGFDSEEDIESLSVVSWETKKDGSPRREYYSGTDPDMIHRFFAMLTENDITSMNEAFRVSENTTEETQTLAEGHPEGDWIIRIRFLLNNGNTYEFRYWPDHKALDWYYGNQAIVPDGADAEWIEEIIAK